MKTLTELVKLSPGFNTAVSLQTDLRNDAKVSAYIPTDMAGEVLFQVPDSLHTLSAARSRMLMGTYGTGKSHLALVLARLYRDGVKASALGPVLEKARSAWPGRVAALEKERNAISKPFLLVLLMGAEWGSFNDTLLHGLDEALRAEGLEQFMPRTVFKASVERIKELKKEHQEAYARFEEKVQDYGYPSMDALSGHLEQHSKQAYDQFLKLHRVALAGARFFPHDLVSPAEVYTTVAKELIAENKYAGIIVIWDEFGRYLEGVVEDPTGPEGQSIQSFAECCNGSKENQLHLYLICHRSLREYVQVSNMLRMSGRTETQEREWERIAGRFKEFNMHTSDKEVFKMIDQILVQEKESAMWRKYMDAWRDYHDEWTQTAVQLRLFPELTREEIHSHITLGSFPLHPMAAFCLPRISWKVAQNERTMFKFLSDSGHDTLGPYISNTPVVPDKAPPAFTADHLWAFFEHSVQMDTKQKSIYRKYEQANVQVGADDELGKRILRTVALLSVIATEIAPLREDVIAFCLGMKQSQMKELRDKLKSLCNKEGGRERLLVQAMADGAYRFTGAGPELLEQKIEEQIKERQKVVHPAEYLQELSGKLELSTEILATGYSDDFLLTRKFTLLFTDVTGLIPLEKWTSKLEGPPFLDGYALVVLCDSGEEVRKAQDLCGKTVKHPRIVVATPRDCNTQLSQLLRRHEALASLAKVQAHLYGEGADLHDEWAAQQQDMVEAIASITRPLLDPEKRLLQWYCNGEELTGISTRGRLSQAASDVMRNAFPETPRIPHDRLTSETGTDNFANVRRSILDKVFMMNGPQLLGQETSNQHKTVITAVYRNQGILSSGPKGYIMATPDAKIYEAMHKVWDSINAFVKACSKEGDKGLPLTKLITTLRMPPFGIRPRLLSLIIGAVFREHVLRGSLSLRENNRPAVPITGLLLDKAVVSPEAFHLVFVTISEKHTAIMRGIAEAFEISYATENELGMVTTIQENIGLWWRGLPIFSRKTQKLQDIHIALRNKIIEPLADDSTDARKVILDELPLIFGDNMPPSEGIRDMFMAMKTALDKALGVVLMPEIIRTIQGVMEVKGSDELNLDSLRNWHNNLDESHRSLRPAGDPTILMKKAASLTGERVKDAQILRELAEEITGTPLENWQDDTITRFQGRLESAKRSIEITPISPSMVQETPGVKPTHPLPPDVTRIVITDEAGIYSRDFVSVNNISQMGETMRNLIYNSISGKGSSLQSGECETILVEVIREYLK
jgi:hypothetical protein